MAVGFIYILSNPRFSGGLIKIGQSKSDPREDRQSELFNTSVPEPFKMEYFAIVEDYIETELKVHQALDSYRNKSNREFFTCSIPEAILTIRKLSTVIKDNVFYKSPQEIEELWKQKQIKKEQQRLQEEREEKQREKVRIEEEKRIKAWKNSPEYRKQKEREENKKGLFRGAIFICVFVFLLAWVGTWGE